MPELNLLLIFLAGAGTIAFLSLSVALIYLIYLIASSGLGTLISLVSRLALASSLFNGGG